jgi:hypothetical protein
MENMKFRNQRGSVIFFPMLIIWGGVLLVIYILIALNIFAIIDAKKVIVETIEDKHEQGIINITFDKKPSKLKGTVVSLASKTSTESISWKCTVVENKANPIYLPKNCNNGEYWTANDYSDSIRSSYIFFGGITIGFLIFSLFFLKAIALGTPF